MTEKKSKTHRGKDMESDGMTERNPIRQDRKSWLRTAIQTKILTYSGAVTDKPCSHMITSLKNCGIKITTMALKDMSIFLAIYSLLCLCYSPFTASLA